LLAVFQITNKGFAHVTEDLTENPGHGSLIEIASRGVPSLMVRYLYTPLGLPEPDYKLTHRPRGLIAVRNSAQLVASRRGGAAAIL
jgi:hypothetical protein